MDGHVEFGDDVSRCDLRSIVIPRKRPRNLGARLRPDANLRHLSNPRAKFVTEGRPRDAGVRIRIRPGLTSLELRRECGGERCDGRRIKAIPEPPHEHDPLIDGQ